MILSGSTENFNERDKEFTFRLFVTAEEFINSEYVFKIKTTFKNDPPVFAEALKLQQVFIGSTFEWNLPKVIDPEFDAITLMTLTP